MGFLSEMESENIITLIFIVAALFMGAISAPVAASFSSLGSFFLAVFVYYVSYRMTPRIFAMLGQPLESSGKDVLKTGFFPYWLMWLIFWILTYNILF